MLAYLAILAMKIKNESLVYHNTRRMSSVLFLCFSPSPTMWAYAANVLESLNNITTILGPYV